MVKVIISDGDVNRLVAGNSDNGGLQNVNNDHPSDRNDNIGFRLLDSVYKSRYFLNPPAILPISSVLIASWVYIGIVIILRSKIRRFNTFRTYAFGQVQGKTEHRSEP